MGKGKPQCRSQMVDGIPAVYDMLLLCMGTCKLELNTCLGLEKLRGGLY